MPLTDLLTETNEPVRFGEQIKGKMITPSFILLLVETIAQLKDKKSRLLTKKILNLANFFGLRGVRNKRNEEGTIGIQVEGKKFDQGGQLKTWVKCELNM